MWNLNKMVSITIDKLGIDAELLSEEQAISLFKRVIKKYSSSNIYEYQLYQNLDDYKSVCRPEGWKEVIKYIKGKSIVLFYEWLDDKNMVLFQNGKDLIDVLEDNTGFVFYITDLDSSFLLCHNDHDYLISCGESTAWLTEEYNL